MTTDNDYGMLAHLAWRFSGATEDIAAAMAMFSTTHDQPHCRSWCVGTALAMLFRAMAAGSSRQRTAIGAQRISAPLPALLPSDHAVSDASSTAIPTGYRTCEGGHGVGFVVPA